MILQNYHLLMAESANEVKIGKNSGNSIATRLFYNWSIVIFFWKTKSRFCSVGKGKSSGIWWAVSSQKKSATFSTCGNGFDTWRKRGLCDPMWPVTRKMKTELFLSELWRKYLGVEDRAEAEKGTKAAKSIWTPEESYSEENQRLERHSRSWRKVVRVTLCSQLFWATNSSFWKRWETNKRTFLFSSEMFFWM